MITISRRSVLARVAVAGAVLAATAACGQSTGSATSPGSGSASSPAAAASSTSEPVNVVASTNVYGNIVATVGGDQVKVTSIIDDPSRDPHEYEASAQNQLALSKAQLVVENGGGYDDFVDTMLKAAPADGRTLINVADVSGRDQKPATGDFNEHVWYDFPTVLKLTDTLVADLSQADPGQATTFSANGDAFKQKVQTLIDREATIKHDHSGDGVAITEPVPLYMLKAAGLDNKTSEAFSKAVEQDTDVPPAVLKQTLDLFASKKVKLLAYNEQTTGVSTEKVLAAAKANNVGVVPVTETLPAGKDYVGWMIDNLANVQQALGS